LVSVRNGERNVGVNVKVKILFVLYYLNPEEISRWLTIVVELLK
jgi:hypothetical protein